MFRMRRAAPYKKINLHAYIFLHYPLRKLVFSSPLSISSKASLGRCQRISTQQGLGTILTYTKRYIPHEGCPSSTFAVSLSSWNAGPDPILPRCVNLSMVLNCRVIPVDSPSNRMLSTETYCLPVSISTCNDNRSTSAYHDLVLS